MKNSIVWIIAIVVIGGGSFFGGIKYDQAQAASARATRQQQFAGGAGGQRGPRGANGGFVSGEILSQDANSITVKTRDGSSKIIFISGSTQVMKSVDGVATDLAKGQQVMVNGTSNPDGSVSAQSVSIRPPMAPGVTPAAPAAKTQG